MLAITKDSMGFLSFGMKNDPKTHIHPGDKNTWEMDQFVCTSKK